MTSRFIIILGLSTLTIAGCQSAPKAEISASAAPQEEVNRLSQDIDTAVSNHADVLAQDDLKAAQGWLKEAKDDLASKENQKEILDDVRKGRGYLDKANKTTASRAERVQGILDARTSALNAGARNSGKLRDELAKYDDDLRDEAKALNKIDAKMFAEMQGNYMKLGLWATQETELGKARGMINAALDDKAKKIAPSSLKKAQTDTINAENVIAANRNEPVKYGEAVTAANASALFLHNVVATIHKHKGNIEESAAAEIVRSQMQIADLKGDLKSADSASTASAEELASKNAELAKAQAAISVQTAIENARKEFSPEEAEVFQQGDKLVVRLKSMKFSSGRSDLPASSLAILAKVKNVAESLNPKQIVVEGHTDSTGTPAKNLQLSQVRAEAVATYLGQNGLEEGKIQSEGYGFKKPIATNKSAAGRAQNRRVDVIITPADKAVSL